MAKIHQNAQGGKLNEHQKAAGYRYGGNAMPIELINGFPLGPGGVRPDPTLPMPEFAGPWGAGSKPVVKTGGGGDGGGGGEKGKRQSDKGTLRHVGGAGSGKENFAGTPTPTPTPRPDQFSPDLAVSPNPYQPGSPVDPRPTASSGFLPTPDPYQMGSPVDPRPTASSGFTPSPNPFQPGSPVDPRTSNNPFIGGADAWSGAVGQTPNPFAIDPQATAATGGDTQFNPLVRALIERAMAGAPPPDNGVPGPPVVGSGNQVIGNSRPVIDVRKMFGG